MNIKHKLYTGRVVGSASEGTERRGQSGQGTIALGLIHSLQKVTLQVHKWTHCSREGNKMCAHRFCVPRICVFTGPVCVHTESANSLGPAHSTRVPHCCAGATCSLSLQGGILRNSSVGYTAAHTLPIGGNRRTIETKVQAQRNGHRRHNSALVEKRDHWSFPGPGLLALRARAPPHRQPCCYRILTLWNVAISTQARGPNVGVETWLSGNIQNQGIDTSRNKMRLQRVQCQALPMHSKAKLEKWAQLDSHEERQVRSREALHLETP